MHAFVCLSKNMKSHLQAFFAFLVYAKIWDFIFQTIFQEFVASQNRPKTTQLTRLIQGYETRSFKTNFDSWPAGSAAPGAEEGRGKVAGNDHMLRVKLSNIFLCNIIKFGVSCNGSFAEATRCWSQGYDKKCSCK